ncbi:hypothetical protein [Planococcus halocryophilus]|uniref:hypothetical protein n=1 Tax=Planococcus halocryophilus TaxID=1215089 RepID=UPI001F46954A|nr:hypothetical protein [Planococcus halocryophilus]
MTTLWERLKFAVATDVDAIVAKKEEKTHWPCSIAILQKQKTKQRLQENGSNAKPN